MSTGSAPNQGLRQYTVSDLDDDETYDVALFDDVDVDVDDNDFVTFADTESNGAGDDEADLAVNGVGGIIEVNSTRFLGHIDGLSRGLG